MEVVVEFVIIDNNTTSKDNKFPEPQKKFRDFLLLEHPKHNLS